MQPTKNQQLIYKLLTTSTGSALMDSGWAYGRHWQRNQERNIKSFIDEQPVSIWLTEYRYEGDKPTEKFTRYNIECSIYHNDPRDDRTPSIEYEYSISIFHWLDRYFDLTNSENDPFVNKFNRLRKGTHAYIEDRQDEYLESIWYEKWDVHNSYNGDSNLSQVYTLTPVYPIWQPPEFYYQEYYLLSIHQGCDVRGGYTNDIMVKIDTDDFPREDVYGSISYTNYPDQSIPVSNTYDGYHITYDEGGSDNQSEIEQYEKIKTENIEDFTLSLS